MVGPGLGVFHQIPDAPVTAPAGFGDDHIGHHIPFSIFDGLGDELLTPDMLAVAGEDILAACDGAWVGSAFKKDGVFNARIDEERVKAFMDKVKALRKD